MQYIRKNGMIDVNDAMEKGLIVFSEKEIHGARKNKFWFNKHTWMYKEVDNEYGTYEEYSEIICYELAKLLNISNAEYDLATYNEKRGVITRSVTDPEKENMISGTEVLTDVFDDYFVPKIHLYNNFIDLLSKFQINSFSDYEKLSDNDKKDFNKKIIQAYNKSCFLIDDFIKCDDKINIKPLFEYCYELKDIYPENFTEMKNGIIMSNNLYDIWSAVEIYCKIRGYSIDIEKFMNDLSNMFIFDIITNQGDRHADNWSINIDKNDYTVQLTALYDNSGALALNREKAIVNIDDFSKRLKVETKPGKQKGIYRQLKQTIEHSFSGVKISADDVYNRRRNDELLDSFIYQSSNEFVNKLKEAISLLTIENIEKIFNNIETRTSHPIPEIVKNVTREVLSYNIRKIDEKLSIWKGEQNGNKKI